MTRTNRSAAWLCLQGPRRASAPPLILVVDHRDMREALAMVLRSEGFRVVSAADGSEALDVVTSERPDLILLDYAMPGLDGAGFCRVYRQRGGEAPVVLMTAGLLVTLADAALIDGLGWAGANHRVDGLGQVPT
jgi:CheY-like chemotaxis protein